MDALNTIRIYLPVWITIIRIIVQKSIAKPSPSSGSFLLSYICHSIEVVIETDIEDFTNVIPDMIRREITESLFISTVLFLK